MEIFQANIHKSKTADELSNQLVLGNEIEEVTKLHLEEIIENAKDLCPRQGVEVGRLKAANYDV